MLYEIIDDIEAISKYGKKVLRPYVRWGLPSTVVLHSDKHNQKGFVILPPKWFKYTLLINDAKGRKYQFNKSLTAFKPFVGWHNTGKPTRVEQVAFSGNIVSVTDIAGNRAYIQTFSTDDDPPIDIIRTKPDDRHHLVHLLSTQFKKGKAGKLDMTTNGKYPRTFLIANGDERLWIDLRNLRKL